MALLQQVGYAGGQQRKVLPGDVLAGGEVYPATVAGNDVGATAAAFLNGIYVRTPAANSADLVASAANVMAALAAAGTPAIPGTTWRLTVVNLAAFTISFNGFPGAGVTLVNPNIAASSVKNYLMVVTNGTPSRLITFTTVSGSPILSGLSQADIANISVGMGMSTAVANLLGTSVIGINVAAGTVTMSGNANATNTVPVTGMLDPSYSMIGLGQGAL